MSVIDQLGLREYYNIVQTVPEVKCVDCPFYTPKAKAIGGWCKIPTDTHKANVINPEIRHCCFTHARLVLNIPV